MKRHIMPMAMGSLMGPMMLWMLHGTLTSDGPPGIALAMFVGAHVLAVAVLLTAAILGARLSPALRIRIARLHRPSLRHFGIMLVSAALAAGSVHLFIHGAI